MRHNEDGASGRRSGPQALDDQLLGGGVEVSGRFVEQGGRGPTPGPVQQGGEGEPVPLSGGNAGAVLPELGRGSDVGAEPDRRQSRVDLRVRCARPEEIGNLPRVRERRLLRQV